MWSELHGKINQFVPLVLSIWYCQNARHASAKLTSLEEYHSVESEGERTTYAGAFSIMHCAPDSFMQILIIGLFAVRIDLDGGKFAVYDWCNR